ncbi:flagellar FlbD family protein [Blastococcus sp. TF02A-30]|uniref:flagellar FlbD family protein n=1 Tax=Blastococcus sp. TF02A-30 TaxID=2250580 RepID=UPI00131404D4|nr:flagellar FlbD family protein [Blastococcus sp. TF02A-30]
MIAVTCRNGEHFKVDPATIERIDQDPDTILHLVDGRHFVVDVGFDEFLRLIRDHRAAFVMSSRQLTRTAPRVSPAHPSLFGRDLVPVPRPVTD